MSPQSYTEFHFETTIKLIVLKQVKNDIYMYIYISDMLYIYLFDAYI